MNNNLVEIAKVIVANGVEDWCLSPSELFVTMKNGDLQDRCFGEINEKGLLSGTSLEMTNGEGDLVFKGYKVGLGILSDEIDRQWGE